eukprot:4916799-Alexandrium_andersonii.AAC.1
MSDIGETAPLEDAFVDVGLLEPDSQEGQSGRCAVAGSAPEGAPDFARAQFAAGAAPGEARASVAE